jgi:hypothetical protein
MIKREMKVDSVLIPLYYGSFLIINIVYIFVFLGIFSTTPTLIKYLNICIQAFLCLFLMIRFHPFRDNRVKFIAKQSDIIFIFGSAFILFTNLVLVELVQIPVVGSFINDAFKMFGQTTRIPTLKVSIHTEDSGNTITTGASSK